MSDPDRRSDGAFHRILQSLGDQGRIKHLPPPGTNSLSSNDYLGLARHPEVIEAAVKAVSTYGTGSTGSRFLSGNLELSEELEFRIAKFKAPESGHGRVFSSGYHANLSVLSIFSPHAGARYSDAENHASLIDGFRMGQKPVHIFPHNDWRWVEAHISRNRIKSPLIVTESLFSMSGEIGCLPELYHIAKKHDGLLVIDDAHATGTLGPTGRGGLEYFNLPFDPGHMILTGTFSKSLGSLGGFALLKEDFRTVLSSLGRPFIYTTALPPGVLAASIKSLEILDRSPDLTKRLQTLSATWQHRLKRVALKTPIINLKKNRIPLEDISRAFSDRGFLLPVLRHPTVPKGQECLRLSVSLNWGEKIENTLMEIFANQMEGDDGQND